MIGRLAAGLLALAACKSDAAPAAPPIDPGPVRWLRGQLHVHTANSWDSDTRPHRVVSWYAERGYDFIVLTDHNYFTSEPSRGELLVLRGAELTQNSRRCTPMPPEGSMCLLHVNALVVDRGDDGEIRFPPPVDLARGALYQRAIDVARARGALAMINHPNHNFALDADGLADVAGRGATLVEVWNQHPRVNNDGGDGHPDTEALWDDVLSRGVTLWGTATNDTHHYDDARDWELANGMKAVTGDNGWVVVRARKQAASIRDALARGDFYSSTGVQLDRVDRDGGALSIDVVDDGAGPYRIRFIGPGGATLADTEGTTARHAVPAGGYVRAEISDARGRRAWVQPAR